MRPRSISLILAVLFSSLAITQSNSSSVLAATELACEHQEFDGVERETTYSNGWKDDRPVWDRNYDVFAGSNYVARLFGPHCLADGFTEGVVYIQNVTNKSQKFYLRKSTSHSYRYTHTVDWTNRDYFWKLVTFVNYEIDLQANAVPPGRYDLVAEGFKLGGHKDWLEQDCSTEPKNQRSYCIANRSRENGFTIAKSGPTTTVPPAPTWPMDPFVLSDSVRSLDPKNTDSRLSYTAEIGCGLKCKDLPVRFAVRLCKVGTSFTHSSCSASAVLKRTNTKAVKTSLGRMNFYQADGIKWGPKSTPGQYMAYVALQSSARGTKVTDGRSTLTKTATGTGTDPTTPPTTNPLRTCSWSFPNGGITVGSLAQVGMKVKARFTATSCYREPLPTKVVLTNTTTRKSVTMTPMESATTEFPAPSTGADPLGFQTVYDYEVGLSTKTLPRGTYVMHIYMPETLEDRHLLNMDTEKSRTITVSYSKSATSTTMPAVTTTVPGSTPVTGTTVPGSTPVTGTTVPTTGTSVPGSGSGSTVVPTTAPIPDVSAVILTADEFRSGSSSDSMGNVLTTVTGTGTPLVVSYNVTLRCTPSCGALPDRIEAKICPGGPGYGYTNAACKPRQYMNAYTSTDSGYSRKYFHNYFDAGTLSGTWKVYLKVTIGSVVHYPTPIALLTRTK